MTLNRPLKILVGLATLWTAVYPLLFFFALWLMAFTAMFARIEMNGRTPFFLVPFMAVFPLHLLTGLVSLLLIAFYIAHIVKNNAGSDVTRILLGIGLFFLPCIAMPIYYYLYVWLDTPPAWAQQAA